MTTSLLGYIGGHVFADSTSDYYVGACCQDCGVAELVAQSWALLWLLQSGECFSCLPAVICYDSEFAANATQAKQHITHDDLLIRCNQSLYAIASSTRSLSFHHIYSHESHPWNEMVDCICRFVKTGFLALPSIPIAPVSTFKLLSLEWAILSIASDGYKGQFPVGCADGSEISTKLQMPATQLAWRMDCFGDA
eukprot:10445707-Karenia_brevis.AAC.1